MADLGDYLKKLLGISNDPLSGSVMERPAPSQTEREGGVSAPDVPSPIELLMGLAATRAMASRGAGATMGQRLDAVRGAAPKSAMAWTEESPMTMFEDDGPKSFADYLLMNRGPFASARMSGKYAWRNTDDIRTLARLLGAYKP